MKKTNAVRILDQHQIDYQLLEYAVDENDLSAETVAQKVDKPVETVFKTLVLRGDATGIIVAIIQGNVEVDLKSLAKLSGYKKCLMIAQKELLPLTGYIRGGVSPLGMKKNFPTFVDESALLHQQISISAGVRGLQILIDPVELITILNAKTGAISNV
jgi:Cys-tRNA(Pro)/Cys-tRNA(Cys) deacylase